MKWKMPFMLLLAAAATGAVAQPEKRARETAIPDVSSTGVIEWRVVADNALYVRGYNGDWYLVRTMNRCSRLHTAVSLGFVTSALDQLDRFGAILAQGQRCPIASVVKAAPPAEPALS